MVYKIPTEGIATGAIDTTLLSSNVTNALVPVKGIIMFSGTANEIPTGWELCDGSNGTPDLTDKFVVGTATIDTNDNKWKSDVDGTAKSEGGAATMLLGTANLPSHTHTKGSLAITGGNHDHTYEMINLDQGTAGGSASYGRTTTTTDTGGNGSHSHGISGTTGDQGGAMDTAFDILPPFFALAFIMRVS